MSNGYRKKMSRRKSGKYFSKHASKTHRRNSVSSRPQRGGIRL